MRRTQMKHLPFIAAAVLALSTTAPIVAERLEADQQVSPLQAARLDENPVALKRLLKGPAADQLEHALSAAFLKSRSHPAATAPQSLEQWTRANPGAPAQAKAFAYKQLGDRYMAATQYEKAANAFRQAQVFANDPSDSDLNDQAVLAELAASVPTIKRTGAEGASVPLTRDMANLRRASITISGVASPMIIDTGAEISVVAQSVAEKSGMQFLDGEVSVGTTTDNVAGRLAVSNAVSIGGMTFENVLFLVLSDEQLTFANGEYFVDGIIGLPLFTAAGRIGWQDNAARLLLGTAAHPETGTNTPATAPLYWPLYWHDGGLALEVTYGQAAYPAFFDSGASRSSGTLLFKSLLSTQDQTTLVAQTGTRTGVGGTTEATTYILPMGVFGIGGHAITVTDFRVAGETLDEAGGDIGIIGSDILARARFFMVDFTAMTYRMDPAPSGAP